MTVPHFQFIAEPNVYQAQNMRCEIRMMAPLFEHRKTRVVRNQMQPVPLGRFTGPWQTNLDLANSNRLVGLVPITAHEHIYTKFERKEPARNANLSSRCAFTVIWLTLECLVQASD